MLGEGQTADQARVSTGCTPGGSPSPYRGDWLGGGIAFAWRDPGWRRPRRGSLDLHTRAAL